MVFYIITPTVNFYMQYVTQSRKSICMAKTHSHWVLHWFSTYQMNRKENYKEKSKHKHCPLFKSLPLFEPCFHWHQLCTPLHTTLASFTQPLLPCFLTFLLNGALELLWAQAQLPYFKIRHLEERSDLQELPALSARREDSQALCMPWKSGRFPLLLYFQLFLFFLHPVATNRNKSPHENTLCYHPSYGNTLLAWQSTAVFCIAAYKNTTVYLCSGIESRITEDDLHYDHISRTCRQ